MIPSDDLKRQLTNMTAENPPKPKVSRKQQILQALAGWVRLVLDFGKWPAPGISIRSRFTFF